MTSFSSKILLFHHYVFVYRQNREVILDKLLFYYSVFEYTDSKKKKNQSKKANYLIDTDVFSRIMWITISMITFFTGIINVIVLY